MNKLAKNKYLIIEFLSIKNNNDKLIEDNCNKTMDNNVDSDVNN